MNVQRQTFSILTDTGGDFTDTGPPFIGAVLQMRYVADTGEPLDTGADIDIILKDSGVIVASYDNIGASSFTETPSQAVSDTGGASVSGLRANVWSAGESLRVSVAQSAAVAGVKEGTIYVWTGN